MVLIVPDYLGNWAQDWVVYVPQSIMLGEEAAKHQHIEVLSWKLVHGDHSCRHGTRLARVPPPDNGDVNSHLPKAPSRAAVFVADGMGVGRSC